MESSTIRFENRFRYDYKTLRSLHGIIMRMRRTIYLSCTLLLIGIFALSIHQGYPISMLSKVLAITLLALWVFLPSITAYRAYRQHVNLMGGTISDVTVTYTDTEITLQEGQNEMHFHYDQLSRVRNGAGYWMLMIGRNIAIPVDKKQFTQGNPAGFPAFIRERCPQIKGQFR